MYAVVMIASGAINLTNAAYCLIHGHPWGKDCTKYPELRPTRGGHMGHYCDTIGDVPWLLVHSTDDLWVCCALVFPPLWNLYLFLALRRESQELRADLRLVNP